jgi:hypothetical protein
MRLPSLLLLFALLPLAACDDCRPGGGGGGGDPDAEPAPDAVVIPAFRNPVDLPDGDVALGALQLLGADVDGADRNCDICHGLTRARLRSWLELSEASMADCLTDLQVDRRDDAVPMIECLRTNPAQVGSPFSPARLGFYATAAHLDWFDYLVHLGYPDTGDDVHAELVERVQMPRPGAHALYTQAQFDVIAEWVARGLPLLDDLVAPEPGGDCVPSIGPEVATHVAAMATQGWAAVNTDNGLNLYGCAGAASPRDCLVTYPRASETAYGAMWEQDLPGAVIRVLRTNNFHSSFWVRSSADGRFIAQGGGSPAGGNSTIIDLRENRLIGTSAFYDPGFFPDNSGFAFQGGGAAFCDQRLLTREPYDNFISYTESDCRLNNGVALYQHMGAALGGGDYWTVAGQFVSDSGGHSPTTSNPPATFDGGSAITLVPLVHDGTTFVASAGINKSTPGEGDTVMSPSSRLLIARVTGANGRQAGFRMRQMIATPSGNTYSIEVPPVARYCINGGKPHVSFNERWMVLHSYVTDADAVELGFTGPGDPGFAPYRSQGAANLYLVDLLNGDRVRLTRMAPGQYALFPHFRSDGWIYFNVRLSGLGNEYMAATDAALFVAGQ